MFGRLGRGTPLFESNQPRPFSSSLSSFQCDGEIMGVLERTPGREAAYLPEGGGEEFIQRLKAAVRRVNKNKADRFLAFFQHTKRKGQTSV